MKKQDYGNESISMLKGAERVRTRPAVIFGSDGLEGCEHAVFEILSNAIDEAKKCTDKPTMIVAHTTKGAGVSVFEDTCRFHGGQPTPEEYETAIKELSDKIASLEV